MNLPFDKIFILHLAENKDRLDNINNEIKRLGIEDKTNIWWTCFRKISTEIGNNLPLLKYNGFYENYKKYNPDIYGRVFNCSFEHYTIIKTAYLRGFNHILILEDDFKFIDDINSIEYVFNNLPDDYDVIKFFYTYLFKFSNKFNYEKDKNSKLFTKINNFNENNYGSTLCYALSRKGMKHLIELYDKKFQVADVIFFDVDCKNINTYLSNYIIVHENNSISNILWNRNDINKLK